MRLYELVFVVKSSLSEPQRKKVVDTVKSWLKDVKVTKENMWGQKVLAYPIQKELTGHYVQLLLEGETMSKEVEQKLKRSEDILRHLVIRTK